MEWNKMIVIGIVFWKKYSHKFRTSKFVKSPISLGIVPLRELPSAEVRKKDGEIEWNKMHWKNLVAVPNREKEEQQQRDDGKFSGSLLTEIQSFQ